MKEQLTINISLKREDMKLLEKVSEFDRRSKSNTLMVALKNYAKKIGVIKGGKPN